LLMKVVVASTPKPVNVRRALPFSAAPVAPTGGVYVIVIVQLPPGTAGAGGVAATPELMGVPTAQVPPSAKIPVPEACVSVIAVGRIGPASTLEAPAQGVNRQRVAVLVTVMVPVTATVLAGFGCSVGVVFGAAGAMAIVANVSWPLSGIV